MSGGINYPMANTHQDMGNYSSSAVSRHLSNLGSTLSTSLEPRKASNHLSAHPVLKEVGNLQSSARSTLPSWAIDSKGNMRGDLSLQDILQHGSLIDFAMDKAGVKLLLRKYPKESNSDMHRVMFDKLTEHTSTFSALCKNLSGSFLMEKLVEYANLTEQQILVEKMIGSGLLEMCLDKLACRVFRTAIESFDVQMSSKLVAEVAKVNLVVFFPDPWAIRVIQTIINKMPIPTWSFFIKFLSKDENLISVCQDKHGCPLVQETIVILSRVPKTDLVDDLMVAVCRNCLFLSSAENANYVIQSIMKTPGTMEIYRNAIIQMCLLGNLLSMSQDRYASHVVEKAFHFASFKLLTAMMKEILDGRVREWNQCKFDILLLNQYGKHVAQEMISVCNTALQEKDGRLLSPSEMVAYNNWLGKMKSQISCQRYHLDQSKLGRKIVELSTKLDFERMRMPQPPTQVLPSLMSVVPPPMATAQPPMTVPPPLMSSVPPPMITTHSPMPPAQSTMSPVPTSQSTMPTAYPPIHPTMASFPPPFGTPQFMGYRVTMTMPPMTMPPTSMPPPPMGMLPTPTPAGDQYHFFVMPPTTPFMDPTTLFFNPSTQYYPSI